MVSESKGILQKTINAYQNTKIAIIKKVIDRSDIIDENGFLDDGSIQSQINSLKTEHAFIQKEISTLMEVGTPYSEEKILSYRARQEELLLLIAFYASNSIQHIDYCLELINNIRTDFKECLLAIKAYADGNHLTSFKLFYEFFHAKQEILEHYLINKIYGTLLFQEQQYNQSKVFLQKAVEKRPEDAELHRLLRDIYHELDLQQEKEIETMILKQLGECL